VLASLLAPHALHATGEGVRCTDLPRAAPALMCLSMLCFRVIVEAWSVLIKLRGITVVVDSHVTSEVRRPDTSVGSTQYDTFGARPDVDQLRLL
jgi:hypothetical protein